MDPQELSQAISTAPKQPTIDPNELQAALASAPKQTSMLQNVEQFPARVVGDIGTGIAQGAYGLANAAVKMLPNAQYFAHDANYSAIPWKNAPVNVGANPGLPFTPPGSLNSLMGNSDTPMDASIQNVSSTLPVMALGEAAAPAEAVAAIGGKVAQIGGNVAKNAAEGAAYGQSQGQNPYESGAINAAIPLAGSAVKEAAIPAINAIRSKISDTVAPAVLNKFFSQTQDPQAVLSSAENAYRNNYANEVNTSNNLYQSATNSAAQADQQLGTGAKSALSMQKNPFDNSSYISALNGIKDNLNSVNAPASAIGQINHLINTAPDTFSSTIPARKYINSINVDYADPSSTNLKSAVNDARSALIDNVNQNVQNLSSNPAVQDFSNNWDAANQHYQSNVMPYLQSYDKDGQLTDNNVLTTALKKNTPNTSGDILQQFNDPVKWKNDANMQHMANLIGDPQLAQEAQKAMYFQGGFVQGKPTANFLAKYEALSPSRRNQMFNTQEQSALNSISGDTLPTVESKAPSLPAYLLKRAIVPTAVGLGSAIGSHMLGGVPWEGAFALGAGAGGAASLVGKNSLNNYYAGHSLVPFNNLAIKKMSTSPALLNATPTLSLMNPPLGNNQ